MWAKEMEMHLPKSEYEKKVKTKQNKSLLDFREVVEN